MLSKNSSRSRSVASQIVPYSCYGCKMKTSLAAASDRANMEIVLPWYVTRYKKTIHFQKLFKTR